MNLNGVAGLNMIINNKMLLWAIYYQYRVVILLGLLVVLGSLVAGAI
jgi:hypothetical protein